MTVYEICVCSSFLAAVSRFCLVLHADGLIRKVALIFFVVFSYSYLLPILIVKIVLHLDGLVRKDEVALESWL